MSLATILLAILVPSAHGIDSRVRTSAATAALRQLTAATRAYVDHVGTPPPQLEALTSPVKNTRGTIAGPFLESFPPVPCGWTEYRYQPRPDGTFSITTAGDNTTLTQP